MKRINLIPNFVTAFSLACGLYVIFRINLIGLGSGDFDVMQTSVLLLLVAAVADFMDGALARAFHAESQFGLIFDSLADSITFGVAPSVIVLKSLSLDPGTFLSFFAAVGAMVYSLCGVLRLVRYSTKVLKVSSKKKQGHFIGLPIPAAAAATVSLNLFFLSSYAYEWLSWTFMTKVIIIICVQIILGYFMVSRWKFPSLKVLHFRISSFYLVLFTAALALFLLYGIFHFFPVVLVVISWGYIVIGWVLSIGRILAGKKSKTLKEFEPDDTDIF